jgi:hypothetical protein
VFRRRLFVESRSFTQFLALSIAGVLALGVTAVATQPDTSRANGTAMISTLAPPKGTPGQRLINWSGITWLAYPNCNSCGPSHTPTTNATNAVWVDSRGWLHMQVTRIAGQWRGVELRALTDVPYGTYRMVVDSVTADMDPWAVLGMFVYRPGSALFTNEIDIEDSRFPHLLRAPDNAQFTVQPYSVRGNQHGYYISPTNHPLLQQFTWTPSFSGGNGTVQFEARDGARPSSPLLDSWSFTGYNVPTSAGMQLFLVLWMNKNRMPTTGTHSAVVRSLSIQPLGG